jgi:hypothetical protein
VAGSRSLELSRIRAEVDHAPSIDAIAPASIVQDSCGVGMRFAALVPYETSGVRRLDRHELPA